MTKRPNSLGRGWAVAILGSACLIVASTAAQACSVDLGRGWARGGGNGTLIMAKGGKNCGGALWVNPGARLPVNSLKVVSPPRNGTIVTRANTFQYTPKPGFQGQDSFSLTGAGPDQTGAMTTLNGNFAVTVQ
ncbi:hypothetical protein ILT44_14335 [Microvirga sp. BT689]|uniref:Ig-like domain-containing protein n=1 Tax=Microvirga arvi TaxID=2778731 RepID=UPI00194FAE38|nr:Ig-like domain-containing protein [Microvirga arvi]MBM6581370.1 hypothetical protein [Microvirga arvi]